MGKWQKGESGNPLGRPKKPEMDELRRAMKKAKEKNGDKSFLEHFVERAYDDNSVAIALAKKLLPDKTNTEIEGDVKYVFNLLRYEAPGTTPKVVESKQTTPTPAEVAPQRQPEALPNVLTNVLPKPKEIMGNQKAELLSRALSNAKEAQKEQEEDDERGY